MKKYAVAAALLCIFTMAGCEKTQQNTNDNSTSLVTESATEEVKETAAEITEESQTEETPNETSVAPPPASSADSAKSASQIFKAMNSAMLNLSDNDVQLEGSCIICSDKSLNVNGPYSDEELENIIKQMYIFIDKDDIAETKYAALITDDICCAVCALAKDGSLAYITPDNKALTFIQGYDELVSRLS